ncbi:MAG: hypothetical protein LC792_29840 [Actinobacteria bacterium]|nr:hypothetical protein [Actinomycetota bacterium]
MHIEILHVPDCPNLRLARSRLSAALDRTGISASVCEVVVADPVVAEELGMHGSPTITIDGQDPFDQYAAESSLSCRLYWSHGRLDGAPGVKELIRAIGGAQCRT